MSKRRVGFCLSDKKRRKMNLVTFAELCATHGLEVIEIDLTQPLASQGPFDVIVHKLSDVIVEAEYDSQSQQLLTNFQSYVSAHPSVILLDPLPAMTQLLDRYASYRIMSKLHHALRDWCVCSPSYLEIRSSSQMSDLQQTVQRKGLSFPLICKTRVAHGSRSHEMCLIFCPSGLCDVRPPCVLQSFINHGAVLHKVFVVGDAHFTVERPSLKNFPSGPCERETIFFNSHEVSKPESCSDLTALDEQTPLLPPPSAQAVGALVAELRTQLGMALFGVDVILNIHTHTLTVIDINIFPGYEGVPQFFSFLLSHIESVLDTREDPQAAGLPASQATGPPDPQTDPQSLGHCDPQDAGNPASQATCSTAPPSPRTTL
ncbi:inositol-tetrakisphosphate 1-kinase-like isoform X1 [Hypomesus transpacificus]|uniref:inositol-tetrakisphosphate 1-kinase-like isoform X1 n=1 Tax=Hypomesus transpacificus TaxID=137520 RepID=UPI001F080DAC|nr:inositol-tetrakisphosphate 1-kinase-like isoform X1 [Hypomesus transpacificus]